MSTRRYGIARQPIRFEDGGAPDSHRSPESSNSLWSRIQRVQDWSAENVLELGSADSYIEPYFDETTADLVALADHQRNHSDNYYDDRDISSFGEAFSVSLIDIIGEFEDTSVLDIGSGRGAFAEDLRRFARAHVIEADFSASVQTHLPPIYQNLGRRIVADGTDLPFDDGIVERVVSLYSTSLHTRTIEKRLRAYTEAFRTTKPGGAVFVSPFLSNMFDRQEKWANARPIDYEKTGLNRAALRQSAAMDFATISFIRKMIADKRVSLTPILNTSGRRSPHPYDNVAGIFDILEPFSKNETEELIAPHLAPFKRQLVTETKTP